MRYEAGKPIYFSVLKKCQIQANIMYLQYHVHTERKSKKGVIYVYEMKRRKGNGYVTQTYELNRLDYIILDTLYNGGFKDYYHAITITEIMDENNSALGARMTVYKKLQRLVKAEYIGKGIIDNHSDTYYLLEKGIRTIEGGQEV